MTEPRLGAVLRRLRREQDLTQQEVAKRAGISQPLVSFIETGSKGNPTIRVLKKLAKALGVPVTELLE